MERRVAERIEIAVHLICRIPARPYPATVLDASRDGCRVDFRDAPVEVGGTAVLEIPGAPRVDGQIVWARGSLAGIRFNQRLAGVASAALGLEPPEASPDASQEDQPERAPTLGGILRHWMRRLLIPRS
jgi:hypothetical protein